MNLTRQTCAHSHIPVKSSRLEVKQRGFHSIIHFNAPVRLHRDVDRATPAFELLTVKPLIHKTICNFIKYLKSYGLGCMAL